MDVDVSEALRLAEERLAGLAADADATVRSDARTEVAGLMLAAGRDPTMELSDALRLAEERLAALEALEDAIEALDRYDHAVWLRLSRSDAILRLLREDGPLGPTAIAKRLQAVGRDEDHDLVSATLNKMKMYSRGRRVERVGRALWIATPQDEELAVIRGIHSARQDS